MKRLIKRPVITEKTLTLASRGWYTFAVDKFARKEQIIHEVNTHYDVNVTSIRSISMHGKKRRVGKRSAAVARPDWKKMIVQLKKGQKIEAFEVTTAPEEKPTKVDKPVDTK